MLVWPLRKHHFLLIENSMILARTRSMNRFYVFCDFLYVVCLKTETYYIKIFWVVYRLSCNKRVPISFCTVVEPMMLLVLDLDESFLSGHSIFGPFALGCPVKSRVLFCLRHFYVPVWERRSAASMATLAIVSVVSTTVILCSLSNKFLHVSISDGCQL